MPKISVIVPIYNVEIYIEKCLRSLFEQTLDDIEYVFVNDCTPDNSMIILEKVLKEYPHRINQVKIINHEQNQGQAGARASGMKAMTGEYMIHCDPDDWIELNMYESMYTIAHHKNADIVVCDLFEDYEKKQMCRSLYSSSTPHEIISTKEATSTQWYLPCRLVNTDLIKKFQIYPVKGINIFEDMILLIKLYFRCQRIEYIQQPLYHYNNKNQDSITRNVFNTAILQQQVNAIKHLEKFYKESNITNVYFFSYWKLLIKDKFLVLTPPLYKSWSQIFPEVARDVKSKLEYPFVYRNLYYFAHRNFVLLQLFRFYRYLSDIYK